MLSLGLILAASMVAQSFGRFTYPVLLKAINDDLLGIWGDEAATGKEPSDLARHKKTLPVLVTPDGTWNESFDAVRWASAQAPATARSITCGIVTSSPIISAGSKPWEIHGATAVRKISRRLKVLSSKI